MGVFRSLFGASNEAFGHSCVSRSTGHTISDKIGERYEGVLNYLSTSPFGYNPSDLTVLSLLPPIDRCLILEQAFLRGSIGKRVVPVWIDKLSMAYWKVCNQVSYGTAWWEFQSIEFLKSCQYGSKAGFLTEEERDYQEDKVMGLRVRNVCKTYDDTARLLPGYASSSPVLVNLLELLCSRYAGMDIFADVNLSTCKGFGDYVVFVNDRTDFLRHATGRGGGNALMSHYRAAKDRYMMAFPNAYAPWFFGELPDFDKRISEGRPFSEAEGIAELPSYVKERSPCWLLV